MLAVKKTKDGPVALFRKKYKKELKYWWPRDKEYTNDYLRRLYLEAEYYLACSGNKLVRLAVESNEDLSYSIEERERDDKNYIVLGISSTSGGHSNILQWLYYDQEEGRLYEYDLPNDRLVLFDPAE
ncbi:hypothetical protein [Niabella beijingensis]|uniref:hypothetical protein n=1 Tax=Niabella beijingensis TaxID=2872700 RepID=UPI001CC053CF|nr:hypothetical protein [Niabella beijingensis]MBZ4191265.1 hypothetical protein [Niabella beijingensis]